jgi:hypothetical protein
MIAHTSVHEQAVYWHRDLPPLAAEPMGEHTVEAVSRRVSSTSAHRDELWAICHADLMAQVHVRFEQELVRLGGRYAHVLNESIDPHHDAVTDEAWLQGRFTYMMYR